MAIQVLPTSTSRTKPKGHVEILERVPVDVGEDFLKLYRQAFGPLETRSPARQWLTNEEFRHDLVDPSVLKFVTRAADGNIVGLAFMATDLGTVPWISEPYFAHRFPDHYARGAIYYFGAMLVRPERQGGPWAMYLLDHIIRYVTERRGIGCFDCCGFNIDTTALPELVSRASHRVIRYDMQLLDRQEYFAVVSDGFK
jgi:GNAT superfamily N-acetyltransferase